MGEKLAIPGRYSDLAGVESPFAPTENFASSENFRQPMPENFGCLHRLRASIFAVDWRFQERSFRRQPKSHLESPPR